GFGREDCLEALAGSTHNGSSALLIPLSLLWLHWFAEVDDAMLVGSEDASFVHRLRQGRAVYGSCKCAARKWTAVLTEDSEATSLVGRELALDLAGDLVVEVSKLSILTVELLSLLDGLIAA